MHVKRVAAAVALSLAIAAPAFAANKGDEDFLKNAIEGNYSEVKIGRLAQDKGQNEEIKSFGRTLADDHDKANSEAITVADAIGMKPPTGPSGKQQRRYEGLQKKSGAEFDRAFTNYMVTDHQEDLRKYRRRAEGDSEVAKYAREELPVLKKHEQVARSLAAASAAPTPGGS